MFVPKDPEIASILSLQNAGLPLSSITAILLKVLQAGPHRLPLKQQLLLSFLLILSPLRPGLHLCPSSCTCSHTPLHTLHSVSCLAMRTVGSRGEHRWHTISQCCESGPHLPPHFRSSSVQKPGAPYHLAGRTHPYSMMGRRGQFRDKAVGVPIYLGHSDIDRTNKTFVSTDYLLLAMSYARAPK